MEAEPIEKQMSSTNRKEKIFNVRRIHYKQYEPEKYLKAQFSPLHKKQIQGEPTPFKTTKKQLQINLPMAVMSSTPYKQLNKRFTQLREQQQQQKAKKIQEIKEKETELQKYTNQKSRLQIEREKLLRRREQIKAHIQQIRIRNQALRIQQMNRYEQSRLLSMHEFRNMIIAMRYQNGIQIDPDSMTYEELLQLEQRMGNVSKGLSQTQIKNLPNRAFQIGDSELLCSVCYCVAKQNQQVTQLPCKHDFHSDCIKEWLLKEKMCPLCKQQIVSHLLEKSLPSPNDIS